MPLFGLDVKPVEVRQRVGGIVLLLGRALECLDRTEVIVQLVLRDTRQTPAKRRRRLGMRRRRGPGTEYVRQAVSGAERPSDPLEFSSRLLIRHLLFHRSCPSI